MKCIQLKIINHNFPTEINEEKSEFASALIDFSHYDVFYIHLKTTIHYSLFMQTLNETITAELTKSKGVILT